jgi:hypothetical protein
MIAAVKKQVTVASGFEEQLDNIKGILYVKDLCLSRTRTSTGRMDAAHRPGSVVCAGSQEDQ